MPSINPYIPDDTRSWVESYRTQSQTGPIKPGFVLRSATDANYINGQLIPLPAYGGSVAQANAVCNIISPGQRIPGVLNWQVTESLDNITQTAQVTCLDALPISKISTTVAGYGVGTKGGTITGSTTMAAQWHSTIIRYQWVRNGLGIADRLTGNAAISHFQDPTLAGNPYTTTYQENNLLYRQFEPEVIQVASLANFPDPSAPMGDSDVIQGPSFQYQGTLQEWWDIDTSSTVGVGAYYILIDNEVMRVTRIDRGNNYLFVVPGGRGISGTIATHNTGATVSLLGFGPYTSQWTGYGYLMPKDYKVTQSPFRPGNCYVSYEGYGNPGDYASRNPNGTGPFSQKAKTDPVAQKRFDRANNMCFTGYWFSQSPQATLDDSGIPQITITFQSSAHVLSEQAIDPNNIQRSKNTFYSWAKAAFDQIGYQRKLPGSWYDINQWDPSLPGAYPLTISTMYAQDQAFFNHMQDTNMGEQCQYCQAEWLEYVLKHERGQPSGSIAEAKAVGKHIYYESIQVFNAGGQFNAGPIKTFGRLMHALACTAWDNPQQGDSLGTRWTKIPNQLYENLNCWTNGRVWNGRLSYKDPSSDNSYDWSNDLPDDKIVYGNRTPLKCSFTAQYDRQPWSQPMQELASLNNMVYSITREGYPVLAPLNQKLRGIASTNVPYSPAPSGWFNDRFGNNVADNDVGQGEWHLAYGGSISQYTHTIDPTSAITLCYVSCQTAFGSEITFTIPAGGTGVNYQTGAGGQGLSSVNSTITTDKVVMYSNKIGNKEGLQLTSGAQQVDAVSLDNVLLGLDWNTNPASWGLTLVRNGDTVAVDAQPPVPRPNNWILYQDSKDALDHPDIVTKIKKFINFMLERRYIGPAAYADTAGIPQFALQLTEDGIWGPGLTSGVTNLQNFFANTPNVLNGGNASDHAAFHNNGNGTFTYTVSSGAYTITDKTGHWGGATYHAAKHWLTVNQEFIKTDIWWYVQNGLSWDQYVAAISGFPIPQTEIQSLQSNGGSWQIDQEALASEAQDWMKQFFDDAINYGNAIVDDSINKSTQKVITSNIGDPRIQLGDVIWTTVPGYMSSQNAFGNAVPPFENGIYVTGITRTIDLQQGTYQASYSGCRYRGGGNFQSGAAKNPNNFVSTISVATGQA